MLKKISIKDIAQRLNISITTVSFVINGKATEKSISKEVTKKVLDLVAEVGFRPNSFAKSLRTGKSNTIGFLVENISAPFFSGIASFLEEKARSKGYKILFSSIGKDKDKFAELIDLFTQHKVDGYIMAVPDGMEEEIKKIIATEVPVVLFDRYIPEISADYVLVDNFATTFTATKHLMENGYRKCAFVTAKTQQQQMLDRLDGYRNAILNHGGEESILEIEYERPGSAVAEIRKFLKLGQVDSVIFGANYITMEGLRALREADGGLSDDVAVISFDDFELLELISPSVTAIEQPLEKIAHNIMKILLAKLDHRTELGTFSTLNVPCKLNFRKSSEPKT
ncbi:LacI family DNA-binding transcriptional regulator [Pedobacter sp. R-06]|uniref:LacI family DNA-binding transcriptional regulator n=1 Tax=Pedobacter sp. R-06 TaxID=3404051 RepID=UPI003CE9E436